MKKYIVALFVCVANIAAAQAPDPPVIIRQQPLGDQPGEEEIPWKQRSIKDKIRIGANATFPSLFGFGGSSSFSVGIAPMVGLRVTPSTTTGVGLSYDYSTFGPRGARTKLNILGGRLFVQQHLNFAQNTIPGLFLWGEAEQYSVLSFKTPTQTIRDVRYDTGFLVGGGYGTPAGQRGFQITMLYHANYSTNLNTYSPSGSPLIIRIGWWFK